MVEKKKCIGATYFDTQPHTSVQFIFLKLEIHYICFVQHTSVTGTVVP